MAKTFICSDESINSYGFRVLTEGIDLTRFLKNPIGLFNHMDEWDDENYAGPICKWPTDVLKKENGELKGTPEFDIDDPKGKLIANKVDKGFLNAASIGFRIIETSEDPKLMLPGQRYATVTKCELVEISIVDIPSNENACCLYDDNDKRIELKDGADLLKLSAFKPKQNNFIDMKKITLKAGLIALAAFFGLSAEEATTEKELEFTPEKQAELNAKLTDLATLSADKTRLERELSLANADKVKLTADLATANAEIARLGKQPGVGALDPNAQIEEGAKKEELKKDFLCGADADLKKLKAYLGIA